VVLDGLKVTRYPVSVCPDFGLIPRLFRSIPYLPPNRQEDLLLNTGYSARLLEGISERASTTDIFIFTPYIYPSTVYGALIAPEKSLVMPALHDEERAHTRLLLNTLERVAGLLFLSQPEADLARRLMPTMPDSRVIGTGVEVPKAENTKGFHLRGGSPAGYIAYAGRREGLKNYPLLLQWMAVHRSLEHHGESLELVTMGGETMRSASPNGRWIHDLRQVSVAKRQAVLASATALANLSLNESFSLVLMESWLAGTPVIVHADCPVTRYHCEVSGGGVWVGSEAEFCETVSMLSKKPNLRSALGRQGQDYVRENYSWDAVMRRLESAIMDLSA
jgi:glycosyltransferase involved in cell wall biosynthesis